jgi:succinate-semialdehyde dehydrogenase/glutarate-semialdehyde dehydrogenase
MELGGHAPVIVCADADIPAAAKTMATSKFRNAGQVCVAPTRFLVESPAFEGFLDAFTAGAKAVKVGNGLEPGVAMGPLANERRIPALESLIADAVAQGAEITTGGRRIGNTGNFFEPTVLANVPTHARIMNEEPFGPVAIVNRFATLDNAIAEANRLPFGLAAYAFTRSNASAHTIGQRVEAGMLSINHLGLALPEIPFGGMKESGYGTEGGSEAIESYLVTRLVTTSAK